MLRLSCMDFHEAGLSPPDCCDSCHDSFGHGYDDMVWVDPPQKHWRPEPPVQAHVCCAVSRWLSDDGNGSRDTFALVARHRRRRAKVTEERERATTLASCR